MDWANAKAPGLAVIEAMAEQARAALPEEIAEIAAQVVVRVEDFAPDEILAEFGIDTFFGLTGLYEGIPITEKSTMDQPVGLDTIWLFRQPILEEWADRSNVTLGELVSHVYVHELAHHMGWSDDDIAAIDRWWE